MIRRPSECFFSLGSRVKGKSKTIQQLTEFFEKNKKYDFQIVVKDFLSKISIEQAVNEWLDTLKSQETKRKYKKAIERILLEENTEALISPKNAILIIDNLGRYVCGTSKSLEDNGKEIPIVYINQGIVNRLSTSHVPESMRKINMAAYSGFCDYIKIVTKGLVEPEPGLKQLKQLKETEDLFESIKSWPEFLKNIKTPFDLIGELIFYTAYESGYRIKVCDVNNSILNLETNQIDFKNNTLFIKHTQSYHELDLLLYCNEEFMNRLRVYLCGRGGLVFVSDTGKKLFPKQVSRALIEASKKYGAQNISPVTISWAGIIQKEQDIQNKSCGKVKDGI